MSRQPKNTAIRRVAATIIHLSNRCSASPREVAWPPTKFTSADWSSRNTARLLTASLGATNSARATTAANARSNANVGISIATRAAKAENRTTQTIQRRNLYRHQGRQGGE